MSKKSAERMKNLRDRRKELGLIYVSVCVMKEDAHKIRSMAAYLNRPHAYLLEPKDREVK